MTAAQEQQIAYTARTNGAVRALVEERAELERQRIELLSDLVSASKKIAALAQRDIERCAHILELAAIAEEFATIGVDVDKKRRVVAIRKTAEP